VTDQARHRFWLLLCCAGFAILSFTTKPGHLIPDTKLDLAFDPIGWLERATHLWDLQHFGQLQNQAAGYLFPMGPFFALGELAGLDAWITQRLWLTVLFCAAFLGAERLAAKLGVGTPGTRIAGALAYALAPRALSIVGEISVEWLPAAMLPWILIPLLTAAETGQRARAAVRSGLAVALCGGVNAVAVLAVLVAPVLYILTRPRPVPRWRLLGWWTGAVAVATLFWSLPLLLAGRYAFSFLPYTETSAATTQVTSLTNVIRGASDWVRFLPLSGVFEQPPGFAIATSGAMVAVTGLIAALGLAGLARRDLPAKGFLVTLFLVGTAAVAAGHISALEPAVAEPVRWLLDGPLAPLRNLRKFDPLVRLALAFGLAHLLASVLGRARLPLRTVAVTAFAALVLPVFNQGLAYPGVFKEVPDHWRQAAAWLDENAGDAGVLVVPGAAFGEYVWGRPMDEPLQPLSSVRWTARQITPPGSVGLSRLLDAIDQRLAAGHGSPGLTEVLRRMGVRYVVARNDLIREDLKGAWPARIHEALTESPGITKVRSFGEPVGDVLGDDAVDLLDGAFPALDLYEVEDPVDLVTAQDAESALRVRGGPDSLLAMGDLGLLGDGPILMNDDAREAEAPVVVSDALRLRERHFGELRSNISPTLTADERANFTGVLALDLLEDGWLDDTATAEYRGIARVSASSSAADAGAPAGVSDPSRGPWSAMDGDSGTAWETDGASSPEGQWLQVDLPSRREVPRVQVMFAGEFLLGQSVGRVAVETEAGRREQDVERTTDPQWLTLPEGPTSWIRITILSVRPGDWAYGQRAGIVELNVPGVTAGRTIRPPGSGDVYVMDRGLDARPGCMRGLNRWVCNPPRLARTGEESSGLDRTFTADEERAVTLRGSAVLRDSELVDRYTRVGGAVTRVSGTSQLGEDAVVSPRAAFDGDLTTTWVPADDDREPALTVAWKGRKKISAIQVGRPGSDTDPLDVVITGDDGVSRGGRVDERGHVEFEPIVTSHLRIRFHPMSRRVQVTELSIPGVAKAGTPGDIPLRLGCGAGPRVEVNGTTVETRVSGSHRDLLEGRPVQILGCEKAELRAGDNRIRVAGWDPFQVENLALGVLPGKARQAHASAAPGTWTQAEREVRVNAPRDSFLVVAENFNAGWRATIGDRTLRPVRIDGWKQGWELPAGTAGTVKLVYLPDGPHWLALAAGLGGIALLALISVVPLGPRPEHVRTTAPADRSRLSRWRAPYATVAGLAFGYWIAGAPGMLALDAAGALTLWLRGRWRGAYWLTAAAFCAAAGTQAVALTLRGYGIEIGVLMDLLMDPVPQLAACAAVGALFGQLVTRREPPAEEPEPRAAGQLTGAGRA